MHITSNPFDSNARTNFNRPVLTFIRISPKYYWSQGPGVLFIQTILDIFWTFIYSAKYAAEILPVLELNLNIILDCCHSFEFLSLPFENFNSLNNTSNTKIVDVKKISELCAR